MTGVRIWADRDASRVYVKLAARVDNQTFHESFLRPMKTLGFRFDAEAVAHYVEIGEPPEWRLLLRQLEANFEVSRLEKSEICYWLGLDD